MRDFPDTEAILAAHSVYVRKRVDLLPFVVIAKVVGPGGCGGPIHGTVVFLGADRHAADRGSWEFNPLEVVAGVSLGIIGVEDVLERIGTGTVVFFGGRCTPFALVANVGALQVSLRFAIA